MEGSWRPPRPEKSALDSLLGAPRRVPRQFSAMIGAKSLPKWGPKWAQNGVQKRFGLKTLKTQNSCTVQRISTVFEVPGAHFGSKMGSKKESKSGSRRRRLLRASWKPLGSLLDRSWSLLNRSWAALGPLLVPLTAPRPPGLNLIKWWDRKAQI